MLEDVSSRILGDSKEIRSQRPAILIVAMPRVPKPLDCDREYVLHVLFMRNINSVPYFEQMKGRGGRKWSRPEGAETGSTNTRDA